MAISLANEEDVEMDDEVNDEWGLI